jgi:uncharacterized protein (TIGR02246 family)
MLSKSVVRLLVLLAVGLSTVAAKPIQSRGRGEVEAAMARYAETLRSGTPAEVARCYTGDGELQLPGLAALHGREAIEAFLAPMSASIEVEQVTVRTTWLEIDGTIASQWGEYEQVAGEKGKPKQTYKGRYSALWHREHGQWLLERLMMQPQ